MLVLVDPRAFRKVDAGTRRGTAGEAAELVAAAGRIVANRAVVAVLAWIRHVHGLLNAACRLPTPATHSASSKRARRRQPRQPEHERILAERSRRRVRNSSRTPRQQNERRNQTPNNPHSKPFAHCRGEPVEARWSATSN